jgi:hypothetical protein
MLRQQVALAPDFVQEISEALRERHETAANAQLSGPAVTADTTKPRPEADLVSEPRLRARIVRHQRL